MTDDEIVKQASEIFSDSDSKQYTKTTLWKWYFGWRPQILFRVPLFLLFVYQGLWFVWAELQDVIFFFQTKPVTWGSILLIMIFGSILIWFILAPVVVCFGSIYWLYEINIGKNTAWRKFLYSIGIILLVMFGAGIIRLFTAWIFGILG